MYQPESEVYIQVSTGYGMAHGFPQYTFAATPLGTAIGGGDGRGAAAAGVSGGSGATGLGAVGALASFYASPIFSAMNSAAAVNVGPASATAQGHGQGPLGPLGLLGPGPGPFHFQQSTNHNNTNNTNTISNPNSNSHSLHHHHHLHHHQPSVPHSHPIIKMEPNQDDLVAQEAAAREYQPHLEGPLVGNKTPSTAITDEYAKADPVYVQKTMVLPQTYSHYRPIQGDGNCGWRAIGFGYFETLVSNGSKAQVEGERQRLESLNGYIENVGGFSPFIFQDMAEETTALLDRISLVIDDPERAMAELTEAFNTPDISNSIIYHLRLLASSWLKGHRESYAAFITSDVGIDGFCRAYIELPNVEIEHVGLNSLVSVLLKPAGFVVEVAYLDRSPGSQVNTYRIPDEASGQHPSDLGPMIHLLFRPDHYDILYPASIPDNMPANLPANMDLQVHRVASFSHNYEITSTSGLPHSYAPSNMLPLAMIPGLSGLSPGPNSMLDVAGGSPITSYTSSPGSSWMPSPFADPAAQQAQQALQPVKTVSAPTPAPQQNHPLRFSEYCQLSEWTDNDTWREPTFQTSTFKNSHYNVAHYNNPNFQPEEYKPDADEFDQPSSRGGSRKRSSI
ncbi:peptidase C65 Otubain-domain-containing protein [Cercophora scortea]|uniref:ubiquitinyl hydrolase 1 n=1 Tax=Cercophora scortea TaxID=314031 RepID=A0AAE0J372_9PEZI|nr:peptidase C65 Otubain-domain-containing protein [Cercophora scortea]